MDATYLLDAQRLADLKAYLNVEGSADDALICQLFGAAVEYLEGAGIPPSGDSHLYDLAVNALVLSYYDDLRLSGEDPGRRAEAPGLRRIINQLKLSGYPQEGA